MIDFLIQNVNRNENLLDLMNEIILKTDSIGCSVFLIDDTDVKFKCINHLCLKEGNSKCVKYEPEKPIDNIFISRDENNLGGYISPCKIFNIIIIPIVSQQKIGILILLNRKDNYDDELIKNITPYITLFQIILHKEKILQDFKKLETFNLTGQSRDLFLANISHEIRTPLNGIIGYSQLLSQTNLTSTQKNYIMSMNQCGTQLMKIINDILDFSKLSCGKMLINNDCFDIREIIESIQDTIKQKIIEKKQKINFILDKNIPQYIITDKQKLIQIIINLISNANKFSDIGENIYVILDYKLNTLEVNVKDHGIGISSEDQYKLFNTFIQVNNAKIKNGTGLGLYITKKLVELLGGSIKVESCLTLGTTFTFNIKIKPYNDYEKNINYDDVLLKDKYILIVDDNTDNRILLSEILFEWEMKPIICASALEALRMIMCKRYNFSLGLIDICMPGISGIDLAKQIKEENPFFPMIALSSIDSFVNSSEFEYKLDKPINKVRLFSCIKNIINKNKNPDGYFGHEKIEYSNIIQTYNQKILIAEDISYNSNLLINMLEILNYKDITVCKDGKETIDEIEKSYTNNKKYDILLLDLIMPHMNGYDVINILNRKEWDVKIIVITASVLEEDINKCKKLGIKYFINKPIDLKQLKQLLIHCLN